MATAPAAARFRAPAPFRRYLMLIGGEWVPARSGATFETVDPFTGRPWAEVPRAGAEDDRQRQAHPRDGGPTARAGRRLPQLRGGG